jgi:hypothetical protein
VTGGQQGAGAWKHSSSCQDGGCVEVASIGKRVGVRDSESPGDILTLSAGNWREFVAGVKSGEFGNERLTEP